MQRLSLNGSSVMHHSLRAASTPISLHPLVLLRVYGETENVGIIRALRVAELGLQERLARPR